MNRPLIIESLTIDNFRGLNNLTLNNFANVNIFIGANNCGKTSVLEAIKLLGSPDDMGQIVRLALQRAQASAETKKKNFTKYVSSIFQTITDEDNQRYCRIKLSADINSHHYAYEAVGTHDEIVDSSGRTKETFDVSIRTSVDGGKINYKSVQIVNAEDTTFTAVEKPLFEALYLHSSISFYRSCAVLLTNYILKEGKQEVLHILQTFDSNIRDISIVGEDIYLHNNHSGSMPLFTYGSGLQKAVFLTIAIAHCKDGVILIDEIDNAIHVSAFKDVFSWFLDACLKWHVQAFITTHSAEAIDAILNIAHDNYSDKDVLRTITLRKDSNTNRTRKKVRSGQQAFLDRECFRTELRI